jgi:hypothetical protein
MAKIKLKNNKTATKMPPSITAINVEVFTVNVLH